MNAEPVVASDKPAEQIVYFAKRNSIDFIIMATHGRSGVSRQPYGSVAEKIMRASSVPILVVMRLLEHHLPSRLKECLIAE